MHAAVQLIDRNKTVAVVERNNRLGGHAETYRDPDSGKPVDYGVVIFPPIPAVRDFFGRFDIELLNMSTAGWNEPGEPANGSLPSVGYRSFRRTSDFRTGTIVELPETDPSDALKRMSEILEPYDYILRGPELPNPIPEDLYIPFGAFIEKYDLGDVVPIWYQFSQGMGDLLHMATLYAIKYFNRDDIRHISEGYLTTASGAVADLFAKAGKFIGHDNLFLESTVITTNRHSNTTHTGERELLIATKDAGLRLLSCRQVLFTAPPTPENLGGWDLSRDEQEALAGLTGANGYWTGLVTNVGLNQSTTQWNSAADTPFHVPVLPALYALTPTGVLDDVWTVKFGANDHGRGMPDATVRAYVCAEIRRLQRAVGVPETEPEFLVFSSHTPFMLHATGEAVRDGAITRLAALQGGFGGSMFYSGAAFHTSYSALLWRFNEDEVIPRMLASDTRKGVARARQRHELGKGGSTRQMY